jgi:hypothetical protein
MKQIQQAAWKNTPEIKRLLPGNKYPMEIRQLVTEKRKLRKKMTTNKGTRGINSYRLTCSSCSYTKACILYLWVMADWQLSLTNVISKLTCTALKQKHVA